MTDSIPPLVTADWLASKLRTPAVRILDATFFLPHQGRSGAIEFRREHIPGARFFDIDEIADRQSPFPHMLPSADRFAVLVGELGVDNDSHVVVYDSNSFMASARVWWTFRVFGHDKVSVLDGGYTLWKALNLPVDNEAPEVAAGKFEADYHSRLVCSIDEIRRYLDADEIQIVDARSPGRFAGTDEEPRPGLRSGHIPKSFNLPFADLVNPADGRLGSVDEITKRFQSAGISLERPLITTCGSGVTASILALALSCIGRGDVAVYDGSWAEWGSRSDTPIASHCER